MMNIEGEQLYKKTAPETAFICLTDMKQAIQTHPYQTL